MESTTIVRPDTPPMIVVARLGVSSERVAITLLDVPPLEPGVAISTVINTEPAATRTLTSRACTPEMRCAIADDICVLTASVYW